MKPYPVELRSRIVTAVDRGVGSVPQVAALFGVSVGCVTAYLRLRQQTGALAPRPDAGGRPPAVGPERYDELRRLLAEQPDLTLDQIRQRLGLSCSLAAICRALQKLDLPRKKKTLVAAEQQRPDVQAQRDAWAQWQATLTEADLDRLVFWDETWAITVMTPLYGRAPRGVRVVERVPAGHWQRLTVAAAVRRSGVCGALVYEGGTTAEAAEAFATAGLAGGLRRGDVVLMDNLSSHVHKDVLAALTRQGVTVKTLPPYSPDLSPIEKAWSKVKQALRQAKARTTEALLDAVADALRAITPEDIRGWFTHCGYYTDS